MLVGFKFENYSSFKDEAILSMQASKISGREENVFTFKKIDLLKSVAIYGHNASGKSNILKAFGFMKRFVLDSSKLDLSDEIKRNCFKLDEESKNRPSLFEVQFSIEDIIYTYGFKVMDDEVQEEWLKQKIVREVSLFERKSSDMKSIKIGNSFTEGKSVLKTNKDILRKNALFLPIVASFNGEISNTIIKWLKTGINIISADRLREGFTIDYSENNPEQKSEVLKMLKKADLGINDFSLEEEDVPPKILQLISNLNEDKDLDDVKAMSVKMSHQKYDFNHERIGVESFDKDEMESEGTNKYFALAGPLLDTLKNGKILMIDELDAKLHPLLVKHIVELFNSYQNTNNAQLIINAHDTYLFDSGVFRRDQIWFTEKNKYGESSLYSLDDFNGIRKDKSYLKEYLLGIFGAIPKFRDECNLLNLGGSEMNNLEEGE